LIEARCREGMGRNKVIGMIDWRTSENYDWLKTH
jgi:hypothetical protein